LFHFEGAIDGQLPSPNSQLFMDASNWLLKLNPLDTKVIQSLEFFFKKMIEFMTSIPIIKDKKLLVALKLIT
jgi:hypothetical protein